MPWTDILAAFYLEVNLKEVHPYTQNYLPLLVSTK